MSVSRTFLVANAAWGGNNWNSSSGGPISLTIAHSGTPVASRTGTDLYPTRISVLDRQCVVTLVLGEFKQTAGLSASSANMSAYVYYTEGANAVNVSIGTLRLYEVRPTQNRANPSECALTFIHESPDGTTAPIS